MCYIKDKVSQIVDEYDYYDPNIGLLTEEELREVIERYGGETVKSEEEYGTVEDLETFICELEANYGHIEVTGNYISAEEILELYDENGNRIKTDEPDRQSRQKGRTRDRGIRRGGRKKRKTKDTQDMKVVLMNCDGFTSKKESIEEILSENKADILLLNETNLKGKRKVRIKDYFSFNKNRIKAKGGVATVVANYLQPYTVKVGEGKVEDDEYVITRVDNVVPAVNIVNIYGQQECRTPNDQIYESWLRLCKDLNEIEMRGEAVLIMGDLNRAMGGDDQGVLGNHDRVSYGGQLLRDMVKERNYTILNNLAEGNHGHGFREENHQLRAVLIWP